MAIILHIGMMETLRIHAGLYLIVIERALLHLSLTHTLSISMLTTLLMGLWKVKGIILMEMLLQSQPSRIVAIVSHIGVMVRHIIHTLLLY